MSTFVCDYTGAMPRSSKGRSDGEGPKLGREGPKRRRDAEENRTRIIAAAREVFALQGFEAPLSEIASRSGVGRATLYRNFPDRVALAAAIFEDNLVALEARAAALEGQADAFWTLLEAMVEQQVEAHAIFPTLLTGPKIPALEQLTRRTRTLIKGPLQAAVEAGAVRSDLGVNDVITMLAMIAVVVTGDSSVSSRRRRARRVLELLSEGLQPRGA